MYSRFRERPAPSIQLPENYSGCAFGEAAPSARPSPAAEDSLACAMPPTTDALAPPSAPPPPSPRTDSSDELLLLGMMLLFFRGEEGHELLPLLALLLFCS